MTDELSGISGVGDNSSSGDRDIDTKISGISDLNDLANLLTDDDILRGISRIIDNETIPEEIDIEPESRVDAKVTIERQLSELEQINDQVDLLRNINKGILQLSERVSITNERLLDVIQAQYNDSGLNIIDIDHKNISDPNQKEDLTRIDNIRTTAIKVKADPKNDSYLYIGGDDVTVNNGYKLEPGESETFFTNIKDNILKIISEESDESYSYIMKGF